MEAFYPVGVLLVLALGLCFILIVVTHLFGPKVKGGRKFTPYECGVPLEADARQPFQMRYYFIAVLFLLFDIEAAFIFPWALIYRQTIASGATILMAMLVYLFLMVLALVYLLRKDFLGLK